MLKKKNEAEDEEEEEEEEKEAHPRYKYPEHLIRSHSKRLLMPLM